MELRTGIENGGIWFERCFQCGHATSTTTCKAFPDWIPDEIQTGQFDHAKPHPGDSGIRFEAREIGAK